MNGQTPQGIPTTARGVNKDQYGNKFGKKQAEAVFKFSETHWSSDVRTTLKTLLKVDIGQKAFLKFLKAEYGKVQLESYLDFQKLEHLDADARAAQAIILYRNAMGSDCRGVTGKDIENASDDMWEEVDAGLYATIEDAVVMRFLSHDADLTLGMLAFDAFPRFISCRFCTQVLMDIKASGLSSKLELMIMEMKQRAPRDADEWINSFVALADRFPACIVITDMTIAGAPMIFVNREFSRQTGYSFHEAVGRNCRFLQGPESELESIHAIRSNLSKGKVCRVKITNYRKNGQTFQNLLSMRPVLDADQIYRFVIGVQFVVENNADLNRRLIQLDKLFHLLPTKIPLRSKPTARTNGILAIKKDEEPNPLMLIADQLKRESAELEKEEDKSLRPKNFSKSVKKPPTDCLNTIFGFTKIMWLMHSETIVTDMITDKDGHEMLSKYLSIMSSIYQTHFKFICLFHSILNAKADVRFSLIQDLINDPAHKALRICCSSRIFTDQLTNQNIEAMFLDLEKSNKSSVNFLAKELLPRFMNSKLGFALINILRVREEDGLTVLNSANGPNRPNAPKGPLRTVAFNISRNTETFWFEMYKVLSESIPIGMVISDMSVPGCPLAHLNTAFSDLTGYQKDKIGTNCKFLQGIDSEPYLIEDIMLSLQQSEPLLIKLSNYKIDGSKFQCLLALQPIFGWQNEYKYQIGIQIEFQADKNMQDKLRLLDTVLYHIPRSLSGEDMFDIIRIFPTNVMGDSTAQPCVKVSPLLNNSNNRGNVDVKDGEEIHGHQDEKTETESACDTNNVENDTKIETNIYHNSENYDTIKGAADSKSDYHTLDGILRNLDGDLSTETEVVSKKSQIRKDDLYDLKNRAEMTVPTHLGVATPPPSSSINELEGRRISHNTSDDYMSKMSGTTTEIGGSSRRSEKSSGFPSQVPTPPSAEYDYHSLNASLTKIMWLQCPGPTLRNILRHAEWKKFFVKYAEDFGTLLVMTCLDFWLQSMEIENTEPGLKQIKLLRNFCLNNKRNGMFYFSADMNYGEFRSTDWSSIMREISARSVETEAILAFECFQGFLDHPLSVELIGAVHTSELQGEKHKCSTAGAGMRSLLNPFHDIGQRFDADNPLRPFIERSKSEKRFLETRKKEKIHSIKFTQEQCMSGSGNSDTDNKEEGDTGPITAPAGHIPFEFEKTISSDTKNNEDSSVHEFSDTDLKPSYLMEGEWEGGEEDMDLPCCALSARSYFLDMMRTMSESLSIGMVISDMSVPGCPLAHLNTAFSDLTGYQKDKIGTNCKFLQAMINDSTQSADIQTALDTNQSLLVKSPFRRADGTSFPCLLALHPVFSLLPHIGSGVGNSIELDKFDRYVRVTESMTGDSSAGKGIDFEYEYQVWLFCDTSKSEEVHSVEIAEMARLLRILPQSVLNEMLPCALSEIARLEGICNRSMLSRSFLNECEEGIDITRSMETNKNNHLESIRTALIAIAPLAPGKDNAFGLNTPSPNIPESLTPIDRRTVSSSPVLACVSSKGSSSPLVRDGTASAAGDAGTLPSPGSPLITDGNQTPKKPGCKKVDGHPLKQPSGPSPYRVTDVTPSSGGQGAVSSDNMMTMPSGEQTPLAFGTLTPSNPSSSSVSVCDSVPSLSQTPSQTQLHGLGQGQAPSPPGPMSLHTVTGPGAMSRHMRASLIPPPVKTTNSSFKRGVSPLKRKSVSPNRPEGAPPSHSSPRKTG